MDKVWVVRWWNQQEWLEAFTSEELATEHAWKIVRSLADDPDDLPNDLYDAAYEVEEDAELSIEEVEIRSAPLPESRYE